MLLGEGDASKLDIGLASDAIWTITHAQGPWICRKRGWAQGGNWGTEEVVSWPCEGVAKALVTDGVLFTTYPFPIPPPPPRKVGKMGALDPPW